MKIASSRVHMDFGNLTIHHVAEPHTWEQAVDRADRIGFRFLTLLEAGYLMRYNAEFRGALLNRTFWVQEEGFADDRFTVFCEGDYTFEEDDPNHINPSHHLVLVEERTEGGPVCTGGAFSRQISP
jgi:hypothetical protein